MTAIRSVGNTRFRSARATTAANERRSPSRRYSDALRNASEPKTAVYGGGTRADSQQSRDKKLSADFNFVVDSKIQYGTTDCLRCQLLVVIGRSASGHNQTSVVDSDTKTSDSTTGFCVNSLLDSIDKLF